MSETSNLELPKTIETNWVKLPSEISMAFFLNGSKYLAPESIPLLKKTLTEWELNKK